MTNIIVLSDNETWGTLDDCTLINVAPEDVPLLDDDFELVVNKTNSYSLDPHAIAGYARNNIDDFRCVVLALFPKAELGRDRDHQIIIYTGVHDIRPPASAAHPF